MAIFYATDYYPENDGHFKAFCKVCTGGEYLKTQFYETGCGKKLAICEKGHFHTPKQITLHWGEVKWRPLPEFCLSNRRLKNEQNQNRKL